MARANKARKWSNLKGQVPDAAPEELSERMLEVFAAKDERNDKSMDELIAEYASLEEEEAFEVLAASKRSILYEALDRRILEELAKVKQIAGTDMWRGDGRTASPKYTPQPIVENYDELVEWIKANNLQDTCFTLSKPRLKSIVCEALETDAAAVLTPAERAQLKPGAPGSGAPPPGVKVHLRTSVHHTSQKQRAPRHVAEPDDVPF